MARVKSKNTSTEKKVRSLLHNMGYRFRINVGELPGKPDIVLKKYKTAILVHGCFWHGHDKCKKAGRPKSNVTFWNAKIDRNIARDKENFSRLKDLGWTVMVIWQCELRDIEGLKIKLADNLSK